MFFSAGPYKGIGGWHTPYIAKLQGIHPLKKSEHAATAGEFSRI